MKKKPSKKWSAHAKTRNQWTRLRPFSFQTLATIEQYEKRRIQFSSMSLIHSRVSNRSKSGKTKLPFFPSRTQGKPIRILWKKEKERRGRRRHLLCGSNPIHRTNSLNLSYFAKIGLFWAIFIRRLSQFDSLRQKEDANTRNLGYLEGAQVLSDTG